MIATAGVHPSAMHTMDPALILAAQMGHMHITAAGGAGGGQIGPSSAAAHPGGVHLPPPPSNEEHSGNV